MKIVNAIKDWWCNMDIWMAALTIIWGYFAVSVLMVFLTIVKAICLHFFNYQIIIFGSPL